MRMTLIVLLTLCAIVATAGLAAAQPPPPPPEATDGQPPEFGESRELMEQVMITRLTRRLELTDEQSMMLMRHFAEMRELRQSLQQERMKVMRELRGVLQEQKDEAALMALMEQLEQLENQINELNLESRRSIDGLDLNVWQKAKLELFMSEFQGEMRRVLQRAQGEGPMGARGQMMGPNGRPGMAPGQGRPGRPMMDDPDRPRGPYQDGRGEGRGQRPLNMQNNPRRSGPPEPPPEQPLQ